MVDSFFFRGEIAMNYKVKVYTIDTPYSPFKDPHTILVSPNARQIGVASESVKKKRGKNLLSRNSCLKVAVRNQRY